MSRKPLSLPQIVILALLWITICYIILTGSEQIDGPLILSIIISGTLVSVSYTHLTLPTTPYV